MADLRALMKERKAASKRIDHPYARYSNSGQLSCSLCTLTVKNEVLWPAHLTSKVHRQNVRQAQLAVAEAEAAQAEEEERQKAGSTSSGSGLGTKRGADDEAEMDGGGAKRVRFQDESHEKDSVEGQQETNNAASATGLPAGFFDDPSQVPTPEETSQIQAPEDDEMAEFEAFLAQEQPKASTSTSAAGPAVYSAQATISGQAALFGDDTEGENGENGEQAADDEDDEDEPQETEEERQAREEREELMERIEQEEREQREADERVESMKKRLQAVRAAKKAAPAHSKLPNGTAEVTTPTAAGETARERRRRRLGKQ